MLVTFHVIWYAFTELFTPAWQKDLRDITYFIFEAMKEAKKNRWQNNQSVKIKYSSCLCKHCVLHVDDCFFSFKQVWQWHVGPTPLRVVPGNINKSFQNFIYNPA